MSPLTEMREWIELHWVFTIGVTLLACAALLIWDVLND
jgi:hypothetical protein